MRAALAGVDQILAGVEYPSLRRQGRLRFPGRLVAGKSGRMVSANCRELCVHVALLPVSIAWISD